MINGADIMVKCLEAEGVSVVFGYPGAAICPFYDRFIILQSSMCLFVRSRMRLMRQAVMQDAVIFPVYV